MMILYSLLSYLSPMFHRGNASTVGLDLSFRTILYHHYLEKIVCLAMQDEDHEN